MDKKKKIGYSSATVAGIVILTVLLGGSEVLSLNGKDGNLWATCEGGSCYYDVNITSLYDGNITIYPDYIRADDSNHKNNIKSSEAFRESLVARQVNRTITEEKSFKCPYKASEKVLEGRGRIEKGNKTNSTNQTKTYECVNPTTKEKLFDRTYKRFESVNDTFIYDEQVTKEVTVERKEKSKAGIELSKGQSEIVRVYFTVPLNTEGKFDVELDVYIDAVKYEIVLDPWYDNSWLYKQEIKVQDNSNNAKTDYQVKLELDNTNVGTNFDWSNDGADVRFVNSTETGLLDYYIYSWDSGSEEAVIWVEIDEIPEGGNGTMYMYYGNDGASDTSDGDATFLFFDDFTDFASSINTSKWNENTGSVAVSGGEMTWNTGDALESTSNFGENTSIIVRWKYTALSSYGIIEAGYGLGYPLSSKEDDTFTLHAYDPEAPYRARLREGGSGETFQATVNHDTSYHVFNFKRNGTTNLIADIDGTEALDYTGSYISSANMNVSFGVRDTSGQSGTGVADYAFVRKYESPEPSYFIGAEDYDPASWYENYTKVRKIYNNTVAQTMNGSLLYADSEFGWLYIDTDCEYIYYNDSSTYAIVGTNNLSECKWASTTVETTSSGSFSDSDLIGYWTLDNDGTAPWNIADPTNNGTLASAPTQGADGRINASYTFDGTDDGILTNIDTEVNNLFPDSGGDWSWGCWFKDDTNGVIGGSAGGIGSSTTNSIYMDSGDLRMRLRGQDPDTQVKSSVNTSAWNMAYITWDGTTAYGYFNDEAAVEITVGSAGDQTKDFNIGTLSDGTLSNFDWWGGSIDECQIYSRALTDTEIINLYYGNSTLGAEETEDASNPVSSITWNSPYNTTINTDSVTLNWTTDNYATTCNLSFNGTWYNQTNDSADQTEFTQTVSSLSEGNYSTINVTCGNADGNATSNNNWINIVYPTPSLTWNFPLANTTDDDSVNSIGINGDINLDFCYMEIDSVNYTMSVIDADSFIYGWSGYSEGNHTLQGFCNSTLGVWGSSTISWYFYDILPIVSWNWAAGNTTSSDTSPTPAVTINVDSNCTLDFNGTEYANASVGTAISFTSVSGLNEGNYTTIDVTCEDAQANEDTSTNSWYNVDLTGPSLTWNWSTYENTTANANLIWVNVTSNEAISDCNISIDGAANTSMTQENSTYWYYNWSIGSDGNYTVQAFCDDAYGNTGATVTSWYRLDTSDPVVTWTWEYANDSVITEGTATPTVTTDETANCTLTFNGTDYAANNDSTSHSYTVSGVGDGNITDIQWNCSDSLGNYGVSTTVWTDFVSVDDTLDVHINAAIGSISLPITSYTQTNVTPTGQDDSNGIFEVTNNLTSALTHIAVKTNETINDCLTVYLDPTSTLNTTTRYTIDEDYTLIPFTLATSADKDIWFAMDLYFCPGGDLDFKFDFAGVI